MTSTLRVIVLTCLVSACATTPPISRLKGAMASVADRLVDVKRDAAGHPISFRFKRGK
jgi:hypothetical protein